MAAGTTDPNVVSYAVTGAIIAGAWLRDRSFRSRQAEREKEIRVTMRAELDVFQMGNQELRSQLTDAEDKYERAQQNCRLEVAELRGEVKVLRSDFAKDIAGQVVKEVVDAVHAAIAGDRRKT